MIKRIIIVGFVLCSTLTLVLSLTSCEKSTKNPPVPTTINKPPVNEPQAQVVQKLIVRPNEITVLGIDQNSNHFLTQDDILAGKSSLLLLNIVNTPNKEVKLKDLAIIPSVNILEKLSESDNKKIDNTNTGFGYLYLLTLSNKGNSYKLVSLKDAGVRLISFTDSPKMIFANGQSRIIHIGAVKIPLLKSMRQYYPEE